MKRVLPLLLLSAGLYAQSGVEGRVLQGVKEAMRDGGGRVTFSDLYNDPRFAPDEKAFLGRLYEVFFEIPGYLKREHEADGGIPTRSEMASNFGLSPSSIELLLRVMQMDNRVPPMFERDPSSGEIAALKLDAINGFLASRGDGVKLNQWVGKPLPSFELEKFGGGVVRSEDLKGHPSLIYFWFTGCPPCVKIAPILAELDREHRDSGFRIVGLNADRILEIEASDQQRADYLQKSGGEYPNAHLTEEVRKSFGNVNLYPTLFFSDANGVVVNHLLNFQDKATLEKIIVEMIKGR